MAHGVPILWRIQQIIGTGRRRLVILSTIASIFLFSIVVSHPHTLYINRDFYDITIPQKATNDPKVLGPPTYERLRKWEAELPQHNLNLSFPEGKHGRYVKFDNQIRMLGWNNVFNEVLMNAHLAYESKRSYVFQDYVWKPNYYAWPESQFLEWPPRTPLNAIISGPTAGGPWETDDESPRSISERWFDIVCPEKERKIIYHEDVKAPIRWENAETIFDTWKRILLNEKSSCVEVRVSPWPEGQKGDDFPQVFDLFLWGSERILSMWDRFSKSPTSRLLGASPLVESAVDRNEYLFLPQGPRPPHPAPRNPYERMLSIHVRRGDYSEACVGLAMWNSTFYSWNLLPFLPDPFTPPPGGEWGKNTPENEAIYMERCLPSFDAIVKKIRDSREDYIREGRSKGETRTLDVLYLLTNEQSEWLDQLKEVLNEDGWHTIRTSRDLVLDQEQTDVNMAIDMEIAIKAAVFIGNGWSSFTSNIVHRRLVGGKEPISIRFY